MNGLKRCWNCTRKNIKGFQRSVGDWENVEGERLGKKMTSIGILKNLAVDDCN